MADYKIIEATPEQWRADYVAMAGHGDDIVLAQDDGGVFYFTAADGTYNTAPGITVPDYILDQPAAVRKDELDSGAIEPRGTYYKIDDTGYLYEAPWED